jgi:hypothetical protein
MSSALPCDLNGQRQKSNVLFYKPLQTQLSLQRKIKDAEYPLDLDTTSAEAYLIVGSCTREGAAGIIICIAVCSWACQFEHFRV